MIDLHMHSNCSDGTDSLEELYEKVKAAGITVFALTDHDTVAGDDAMKKLAEKEGRIRFLPGIEVSCLIDAVDVDSDCHIVGLNIDYTSKGILDIVEANVRYRHEKLGEILEYLKDSFGIEFPEEVVSRLSEIPNVGKGHIKVELFKAGYGDDPSDAYSKYLMDFKSAKHVLAKDAIAAIKAAGGLAVWAHPIGDEPEIERHKTREEFRPQLDALLRLGLDGIEVCYSRYTTAEEQLILDEIKGTGLLVSAGSDYHGRNKNVELGQFGIETPLIEAVNIDTAFD